MPITAQQARQELARRELERRGLSPTKPEGYLSRVWEDVKDIPSSMIDPSSDFYRLPRQVKNRVDKDLEATAQMIMSPIETGKGLALSAGAGSDRLLGTNLIEDEEQEEQVIQALKGQVGNSLMR